MKYKKYYITVIALITITSAFAQSRNSSPYSRYGLGDLYSQTSIRNRSMGGIAISDYNSSFINFSNPASYSSIDSMSFLFDGAFYNDFSRLRSGNQSQMENYSTLDYISFAFPLKRGLAASFGLMPYSHVGYKISHSGESDIIGNTLFTSEGSGGINIFYGGVGLKLTPWLSVGMNAGYLFGSINRTRWLSFPDSVNYFNLNDGNSLLFSDFMFTGGILLNPKIGKYSLNTGLTVNLPSRISIKADSVSFTYMQSTTTSEIMDTLRYVKGAKGELTLPLSLSYGLSLGESGKWMIGTDLSWQNWNDFSTFSQTDTFANNYKIMFGGEFTPNNINYRVNTNYFRRITYRGGLSYGKSFLEFNGNALQERGISFGVGLPLRGTANNINLAFAYTSRGSSQDGLLKQETFQICFGLAVHERWFFKRRID